MGRGLGCGWWRLVPLTLGFAELFAMALLFCRARRRRRGRKWGMGFRRLKVVLGCPRDP